MALGWRLHTRSLQHNPVVASPKYLHVRLRLRTRNTPPFLVCTRPRARQSAVPVCKKESVRVSHSKQSKDMGEKVEQQFLQMWRYGKHILSN